MQTYQDLKSAAAIDAMIRYAETLLGQLQTLMKSDQAGGMP